jgi:predicted DNA-binding ArsR family transcriptional regulator
MDENILFKTTGGDFIDQFETGSYIRYKGYVKVKKGKTPDKDYLQIDFNMSLGDCNRVINWDFESYEEVDSLKIDKINEAISILEKAKNDLVKMQRIVDKERARIDKEKIKAGDKDGD